MILQKLLKFITKILITHSNFIDVYLELKGNRHTCTWLSTYFFNEAIHSVLQNIDL